MKTDTPKTDAVLLTNREFDPDPQAPFCELVDADFVRELERENTKLKALIARAMEFGVDGSRCYSATEASRTGDQMRAVINTTTTQPRISVRHYLPCPFCGLDDGGTVDAIGGTPAVALHSYDGVFRVECEGCGCNGPIHNDHEKASKAWNTRSPKIHP